MANLGPMIDPCFFPNENVMKITPKIKTLQLITFRFVLGFDENF